MDIELRTEVDDTGPNPVAWQAAYMLADRLREALQDAGLQCDEVCAVGEAWGFLIEPADAPIGLSVECQSGSRLGWSVSASYDGGLSALWGGEPRCDANVLLTRVEAIVRSALPRVQMID